MKKNLILFFVLIFNIVCIDISNIYASSDTIEYITKHSASDTSAVNKLNNLSDEIIIESPELALKYSEKALEIAQKSKYQKGIATALYNSGTACYYVDDYDKSLRYLQKSEFIFNAIKDDLGLGHVYNAYGEIYTLQGEYGNAIKSLFQALKFFEQCNNISGQAKVNNNIGIIYKNQEEFEHGLKYFFMAFDTGNNISKGDASLNIGTCYLNLLKLNDAQKYLKKAIEFGHINNDKYVISAAFDQMGVIEFKNGNNNSAIDYFSKSIVMKEEIEDGQGKAISLNNMGKVFLNQNKLEKALDCFDKARQIAAEIGVKRELAASYDGLASTYSKMNEFSKAYDYLNKAFMFLEKFNSITKEIMNEETSKKLAQKQMELIEEKKNGEINALKKEQEKKTFFRNVITFITIALLLVVSIITFLIFNRYRIKKKANEQLLFQNQVILQQKEEIQAQAEQLEFTNQELEKLSIVASETNNAVIIADGCGKIEWVNAAFTRLFGYSLEDFIEKYGNNLFQASSNNHIGNILEHLKQKQQSVTYESQFTSKSNQQLWIHTTLSPVKDTDGRISKIVAIDTDITKIKEAEEEIKLQQKELTDSINYAKKIQNSNLPSIELISKNFAQHFVLYMPKDIVSGDFYWFYEIEGKSIFAVADCTGHGVPGAFMSMLGIAFLKEIVVKEYITHSAIILNRLRKEIMRSLQQHSNEMGNKDGMDLALCVIENGTYKLEFSGANSSILLVRGNELTEIKGDNMPIGIYEKMDKFSQKTIQLMPEDTLYLSSDGFKDQFGGPKGKKFLSKNFKQLILSNSEKPMILQKENLHNTIEDWKNNHGCTYDQTDDITVLGIKL